MEGADKTHSKLTHFARFSKKHSIWFRQVLKMGDAARPGTESIQQWQTKSARKESLLPLIATIILTSSRAIILTGIESILSLNKLKLESTNSITPKLFSRFLYPHLSQGT